MIELFESNLIDQDLLTQGDRVVLGVSGGPDSMAMLDMFLKIREKWRLSLFVVHINHGFRGEFAERDAKSVQKYCEDNRIEFIRFDYNVQDLAKTWKMSFEEAGRIVRYEAFEKTRYDVGAQRIAVAQNKNDQAETILMRLMRGTGIDGLKGIPQKRGPYIIRPVLFMKRADIEAYCRINEVPVCHDHTNDETVYTRNKIRHDLLPFIEDNFNGQIVDGLYRLGSMIQTDVAFIESALDKWLQESQVCLEELDVLPVSKVQKLDVALLTRLIRRILMLKGMGLKDVSFAQIDEVVSLVQSNSHGKKKFLSGVEFSTQYDNLYYRRLSDGNRKMIMSEVNIDVQIVEMNEEAFSLYTLNENEISIDLDKIDGVLSVRFRKDGDRFQPMGMRGTKKLKKFFIDLKIPAEKRDQIPLVCDESGIIWVVGHRLSERVKVDESTCRVGIIKCSDSC